MKLRQAMAVRPLALLTLAVLAAHLLVLRQTLTGEAVRPAAMRHLVTRVLEIGQPAPAAQNTDPSPISEGKRPGVQAPRVRPAINSVAESNSQAPTQPAPAPVPPTAPTATEPPTAPGMAAAPVTAAPATAASAAAASAASASPAPAMAFAIPGSVHLRYGVTGRSRGVALNLNGELLWRHDGSSYEAKLQYSSPLLPSRSQQSTGRITAEGLAPQRFSDKGRGEQATHFERDSASVVFSSNAPAVPLLPGAQDRLSVFIQLAAMLAAEPAKFPAASTISLQTAGTRDAQAWIFKVEGDEVLDLPGGSVPSRKLVREPRHEYDVRIELWLGTGMDYVPVRIRLTQPNGDFVDQQWSSTDRS